MQRGKFRVSWNACAPGRWFTGKCNLPLIPIKESSEKHRERVSKIEILICASGCVLVRNYGIGIMWYFQAIHGFHTLLDSAWKTFLYLLFLIRGDAKPLLPGSTLFPITPPTPLPRIFPYIDGYSPHSPSERHPGNTDCHKNPGKLKFQKLLFTLAEWKLFSYMVTCSNCSQIVWNKQINSFSPGKAVYSHHQHWNQLPSETFVRNSKI